MTMQRKPAAKGATVAVQSQSEDHSYSNAGERQPPVTDHEDLTDNEKIYDTEGNFTKRHLRKAVLVTDNFRISNDAYHEIRAELCGQMPPVGQVKREKAVMSEEIPYIKHPTVSVLSLDKSVRHCQYTCICYVNFTLIHIL